MKSSFMSALLPAMLLIAITVSGQNSDPCAFDEIRRLEMAENPDFLRIDEAMESKIQQFIHEKKYQSKPADQNFIIPVVIHVVHLPGTPIGVDENLSEADVQAGLDLLNQAYAGNPCGSASAGIPAGFQFCLAKQDINGKATSGIQRFASPFSVFGVGGHNNIFGISVYGGYPIANPFPTKDYLNIYLVKSICYTLSNNVCSGPLGLASLPEPSDNEPWGRGGIIVESNIWYNPQDPCLGAKISVHETGHYFNLLHTFEGGCANDNCHSQGDRVCDTAPDNSSSVDGDCNFKNSCDTDAKDDIYFNPFTSDMPDPEDNFMDYSNRECQVTFTPGQIERMQAALQVLRPGLLLSKGCQTPCDNPMTAVLHLPELALIQTNSSIFATLTGVDSVAWYVNDVYVSNADTLQYVFQTPGDYTLTLKAFNDSGCTLSRRVDLRVYHQNCQFPIELEPVPDLCTGGDHILHATPEDGFWTFSNGVQSGNFIQTADFPPGTYTAKYSVTQGYCLASKELSFKVVDIQLFANTIVPIQCSNPQPTPMLLFTNANFVQWQDAFGLTGTYSNPSPGGQQPMVSRGGEYTFTAYKNGAYCNSTQSINTSGFAPAVSIAPCTNCNVPNPTINLCVSGAAPGSTYKWSNGPHSASGQQIQINHTGEWTVTVTNNAGCESARSFEVKSLEYKKPTVSAGADFSLPCYKERYLLAAAPPGDHLSIQWTTTDGHIISAANSAQPLVNRPGKYTLKVTNTSSGCSAIDDVLVTRYIPTKHRYHTICAGESFEGYQSTGHYADTVTFDRSCDSIYLLHLTVLQPVGSTVHGVICAGENYEGYTQSGIYTDVFQGVNGCDSVRVLNLDVFQPAFVVVHRQGCEGNVYEGYTQSGIYTDVFQGINGCDSTRLLMLDIFKRDSTYSSIELCFGEQYQGLSEEGIYLFHLINQKGCDSLHTLNLLVKPSLAVDTLIIASHGAEDGSIIIHVLNGEGPYQYMWSNGSKAQNQTGLEAGAYHLTLSDASGCTAVFDFVVPLGVSTHTQIQEQHVQIYPNPQMRNSACTLQINGQLTGQLQLNVWDSRGGCIISAPITMAQTPITLANSGIYLVQVSDGIGRSIYRKLVVY